MNPLELVGVSAYLVIAVPVVVVREVVTLGAIVVDHVTGERWDLRARIPWWARNPRRGKERERAWENFMNVMREERDHE